MNDSTDKNASDVPMDDLNRVAAFSDGELDGEANLHMLEASQHDAQMAAKIKHQQHLRRACQRVMAKECACPCKLKELVEKICDCEGHAEHRRSPVLARIGRWAPAMIAAVLLFGVVYLYHDALMGTGITKTADINAIIPIAQARSFNDRHLTCSRSVGALVNLAQYPDSLTALPAAVADKLHSPVPSLDLTALGYVFAGAGDCHIPGTNSVHLIYQSAPDSGHSDSVSLWMHADDGSLPIDDGTIYTRQCPETNHKLLVWRHAGVLYYLLGDDPDRTETIANSLRTGPAA